MDFGEILTRAWKIIWKYKILWLFGILSSCGQGGGSTSGGGNNTGYNFSSGDTHLPPEVQRFFFSIQRFFNHIQPWEIIGLIALILLAVLILWFVMLALNTVGRVGLIQGTLQGDADVERLTFGELFHHGKPFFWRVMGLYLFIGLVSFVLVVIFIVPAAGIGMLTAGIGFLCMLPLLCILVPLSWIVGILIQQATIILVSEDTGIIESLQRAWLFFRKHWSNLLVMGLILGIGSFVVGIVLALPIMLIVFPAIITLIVSSTNGSNIDIFSTLKIAGLCMLGYMPVLVVLTGILKAYIYAGWTLTYRRLAHPILKETEPEKPETV